MHHALTYQHVDVESLRRTPSELAEVASMAMELFSLGDVDKIGWSDAQQCVALTNKIADDLLMFAWISKVDLFQERLYDHPEHTVQERHDYWIELNRQYPVALRTYETSSWSGEYQSYLETFYHRQMHIFANPFCYIEYGLAQIASMQLYQQWQDDPEQAIGHYKAILASGYTRSIPEALAL